MTRILSSSQDRRKMVDVLTVLPPELMAQSANWKILNLNLLLQALRPSVSMPVEARVSIVQAWKTGGPWQEASGSNRGSYFSFLVNKALSSMSGNKACSF